VIHGSGSVADADYCVCTLPTRLLARVRTDFSSAKKSALESVQYRGHVKVAFESPRFWEQRENIFGGLAWTDRLNENIMYPSDRFNSPSGVLVAAYCAGWTRPDNPRAFAELSHDQRLQVCRDSIEALHPGSSRLLRKGVTVAWGLTPWSEGGGAIWPGGLTGTVSRPPAYTELQKPEGPIVFAGEHLSYQPAWQEGAVLSAHEALRLVHSMASERVARAA
jgi:monoamine oxidase